MAGLNFLNKFKKDAAKLETVGVGIRSTEEWLSLGNYALNRIMSGNFMRGIPLGKLTLLAGPSGCVPSEQTVTIAAFMLDETYVPVTVTEDEKNNRGSSLVTANDAAIMCDVNLEEIGIDALIAQFNELCRAEAYTATIAEVEQLIQSGHTIFVNSPSGFTQVTRFITKNPRKILTVTTHDGGVSGRFSVDHLFNTGEAWTPGENLKIGDKILNERGGKSVVSAIELDEEEVVYDLEVSNAWHSYYVGGAYSHNSGKSFLAGNAVVQAQREGYHVVYLDSEHAVDVDYLRKIGAKVDEEHLTYMSVATIEDVNSILSAFFVGYQAENGKNNPDSQRVLIVLDSLAMLSSETEMENYTKATGGEIKGDMGQLAKRRKAMLRLAVGKLGNLPIAMIITDHVYPNPDIKNGEGLWVVTNSTKFSTSLIGLVTKLKLKEGTDVVGVRMRVETYKSRFAKLGSKIELEVPYSSGMSPLSGLCDLLEIDGVIAKGTQVGEKLKWIAEWTDHRGPQRETFTEKTLTAEQAENILKNHPKCQPMAGRDEPDVDMDKLLEGADPEGE